MNVTFKLIIGMVVVFIIQQIIPGFESLFMLIQSQVATRPWMLVSSMFLHADIGHLLSNMFWLAIFGSILEHIIGRKKFLWLFILTGVIANLLAVPFYPRSLGASGAIFGVMGALVMLRPKLIVWMYVPMPLWIFIIIKAVGDVFGIFIPDGVGNIAHLSGLIAGLVYGFRIKPKTSPRKKKKTTLSDKEVEDWHNQFMRVS